MPTLLYLCWAAPRTLLQFSLLSMTLACAAMLLVDSRWLVERRGCSGWRCSSRTLPDRSRCGCWSPAASVPFVVAAAVVVLRVARCTTRVIGENPLTTAAGWWQRARIRAYGGPDGLVGHTSLRGWALDRGRGSGQRPTRCGSRCRSCSWSASVWLAMRDRSRALDDGGMAIPAMFCLWSLLAIYHNGNNMILMLPAFAFLWFLDDRQRSPSRWMPIVVLQAALMFDVPVRLGAEASVARLGEDGGRALRSRSSSCLRRSRCGRLISGWSALDSIAASRPRRAWRVRASTAARRSRAPSVRTRLVQGDGGDHGEEHAVGRRPQAGVPDALNGDRDEAADGAGAHPEDRRSIGAPAASTISTTPAIRAIAAGTTISSPPSASSCRYSLCAWLKKNSREPS